MTGGIRKPSLIISLKFQSSSRLGLRIRYRHFCWVAVNPKEAENKELTDEVLRLMPEFFNKPNCLGVGETGLHKSTPNEIESLQAHVDMAMKHGQLVLIHTPHLADKAHGTKTVLEVLAGMGVDPNRIWIDHVEEQTIESVLDAGIGRE